MNRPDTGGFFIAVPVILATLKLARVIDWSWWAVTAPLWIPVGVGAAFMLVAYAVYRLIDLGGRL